MIRWSQLSADEALLLARACALDNLVCGRITRQEYERHLAMFADIPRRRRFADSWLGIVIGALLLAALVFEAWVML
jgi:hypothetical protein